MIAIEMREDRVVVLRKFKLAIVSFRKSGKIGINADSQIIAKLVTIRMAKNNGDNTSCVSAIEVLIEARLTGF